MGVRDIVLLPDSHPDDCVVCGGQRDVRVALLRLRFGTHVVSWPQSWVTPCPLSGGADEFHRMFGGVS